MEQLGQEMRKCLDELFRDRVFVETTSLAKWLGVSAKTVRRLGDDGAIGCDPKAARRADHIEYMLGRTSKRTSGEKSRFLLPAEG